MIVDPHASSKDLSSTFFLPINSTTLRVPFIPEPAIPAKAGVGKEVSLHLLRYPFESTSPKRKRITRYRHLYTDDSEERLLQSIQQGKRRQAKTALSILTAPESQKGLQKVPPKIALPSPMPSPLQSPFQVPSPAPSLLVTPITPVTPSSTPATPLTPNLTCMNPQKTSIQQLTPKTGGLIGPSTNLSIGNPVNPINPINPVNPVNPINPMPHVNPMLASHHALFQVPTEDLTTLFMLAPSLFALPVEDQKIATTFLGEAASKVSFLTKHNSEMAAQLKKLECQTIHYQAEKKSWQDTLVVLEQQFQKQAAEEKVLKEQYFSLSEGMKQLQQAIVMQQDLTSSLDIKWQNRRKIDMDTLKQQIVLGLVCSICHIPKKIIHWQMSCGVHYVCSACVIQCLTVKVNLHATCWMMHNFNFTFEAQNTHQRMLKFTPCPSRLNSPPAQKENPIQIAFATSSGFEVTWSIGEMLQEWHFCCEESKADAQNVLWVTRLIEHNQPLLILDAFKYKDESIHQSQLALEKLSRRYVCSVCNEEITSISFNNLQHEGSRQYLETKIKQHFCPLWRCSHCNIGMDEEKKKFHFQETWNELTQKNGVTCESMEHVFYWRKQRKKKL